MASPLYQRVIVKLSGEALLGGDRSPNRSGIDPATLKRIAADLAAARATGVTLGVVVGGGNFIRGAQAAKGGLSRVASDMMGMLATVMNALALEAALEARGSPARTMSALTMPKICETYERRRAERHLAEGRILLLAAGTGNPFFTTDTSAVLRAAELDAEAVFKATDVDGVYSADPKKDPQAKRYDRLTHAEAIERGLAVMDATAFALARENRMPIIVFSVQNEGAIGAALRGEGRSTRVGA
jgi:uridylate kinase